ncbi:hypothetical protein CRE_01389 [Caenorhabditis remanei]|uniref:Integrase catalytic domain-containing protein n=1 Tax=Caenorhabditis remanei TaxID=31234 RepID=E3NG03_CAERE|nr:hypothetical protein CRE_01389 [Caenorhabditis remanei]
MIPTFTGIGRVRGDFPPRVAQLSVTEESQSHPSHSLTGFFIVTDNRSPNRMSSLTSRSQSPVPRSRKALSLPEREVPRTRAKSRSRSRPTLTQSIVGPTKTVIKKSIGKAKELIAASKATLTFFDDPQNKTLENIDAATLESTDKLVLKMKTAIQKITELSDFIERQFNKPEMRTSPERDAFLKEVTDALHDSGANEVLLDLNNGVNNLEYVLASCGRRPTEFDPYGTGAQEDDRLVEANEVGSGISDNVRQNNMQSTTVEQPSAIRTESQSSSGPITSSAARNISQMDYDYEAFDQLANGQQFMNLRLQEENRILRINADKHRRAHDEDVRRRTAQDTENIDRVYSLQNELAQQPRDIMTLTQPRVEHSPMPNQALALHADRPQRITAQPSPIAASTPNNNVATAPATIATRAQATMQMVSTSAGTRASVITNVEKHIETPILSAPVPFRSPLVVPQHSETPIAHNTPNMQDIMQAIHSVAENQKQIVHHSTSMIHELEQRMDARFQERAESIISKRSKRQQQQNSEDSGDETDRPQEAHAPRPQTTRNRKKEAPKPKTTELSAARPQKPGVPAEFMLKYLPKFDGTTDLDFFEQIYSKFVLLDHNFNAEAKYAILLNHITGPAKNCISRAKDSHTAIITTLCSLQKVYGKANNKHSLISKLQKMPFHQTDPESMRMDVVKIAGILQQLKDKGVPATDHMVSGAIGAKLPADFKRSLARYTVQIGEDNITHDQILDYISSEIEVMTIEHTFTNQMNLPPMNELPESYAAVHYTNSNQSRTASASQQSYKSANAERRNPVYVASQHPREYTDPATNTKLEGYYAPGTKGVNLKLIHRTFPYTNEEDSRCAVCGGKHHIIRCPLPSAEFRNKIKQKGLCPICARKHEITTCVPRRSKHFFVPVTPTNLTKGIPADTGSKVPNPVSHADLPTAYYNNHCSEISPVCSTNLVSNNNVSLSAVPPRYFVADPTNITYFKNLVSDDCSEDKDPNELAMLLFTRFLARSPPHQVTTAIADCDNNRLTFLCLETSDGQHLLALSDSGASLSLIHEAKAKALSLPILKQTQLTVQGFSSTTFARTKIFALNLSLYGTENPLSIMIVGTPTLPNTKFAAPKCSSEDSQYIRSHRIDTQRVRTSAQYNGRKIDMILGNDLLSWISAQQQYRKHILPSGRALEQTQLGILIHPVPRLDLWSHGHHPLQSDEYHSTINMANTILNSCEPEDATTKLTYLVAQMYRVENLGIENITVSDDLKKTTLDLLVEFNKTVKFNKDGQLEVALPYNGNQVRLADNYAVAFKRLVSLLVTLKRGKDLLEKYAKIIIDQEIAGYIEKVTPEMLKVKGPKYNIPHRCVIKEDSMTTKLRIVLDASSHAAGELSLNECLYAGTNMITPIFGILVRVRFPPIIVVADIEKAFHQVRLQPEFRNVTMFLWLKDVTAPATADNIQVYRFTRIPFGVASSPFQLAAYITYNLDNNPHDLNKQIKENIYVDNCLFCVNDASEISAIIKDSKEIFQKMGMNLREYIVNHPETMQSLSPADRAQQSTIKLLGYTWNSIEDTLSVKIAQLNIDHPTKRDVASKMAETFDPLGLVSPILVPFKRLMQRIWNEDTNWKDPIPKELLHEWRALCNNYIDRAISLPRQLTSESGHSEIHLLMFSDASHDIYASVCYAYYIVDGRPPVVSLLASKNKIRPSKNENWTIPKLELLGIQCASNLACAIIAELRVNIASIKLFTDSACALYWILSEKNTRPWVGNRIKTIQENRNKMKECGIDTTIHHCPTKENPADFATRGMSTTELQNSKMWFEGPDFLRQDPGDWPCMIQGKVTCPAEFRELVYSEIIDPETKKAKKPLMERKKKVTTPAANKEAQTPSDTVMTTDIRVTRKGSFIPFYATKSLTKLTRIVVQILCSFSISLKNKSWESQVMKEFTRSDCPLHRAKVARLLIITEHYKDCKALDYKYPTDIEFKIDTQGIRRVHRRIESPVLPQEASEPIFIHNRHPLAQLIARETHEINGHLPETYTVSAIRTKYWIPKLGGILKNIIRECVECQKVNNFPFDYAYTKNLPKCRTTPSKPFSNVALDYLGPIMYRGDDGRSAKKAYVLIYTCLNTRGAVLKVVPDGTAFRYIQTLKMIFGEVGVPKSIYSDNASTFKLSGEIINKDIKNADYSQTLVEYLARELINFKFITPLAPWQGGIYERVVKLVKTQITKECGARMYDYYSLQYVVSRAQSMVNNRPLIPHARSPGDMVALRPFDFINPGVLTEIPAESEDPNVPPRSTEATVRAHLDKMEAATERMWKLWSTGYLLHLRENMHKKKRCSLIKPEVGQVVIVVTKLVKRHKWPLGIITEVERSERDGQIRSAIVKVKGKLYSRAVCQLIPLELNPLNHLSTQAVKQADQAEDNNSFELPTPAILEDPDMRYAPELFPTNDLPNIAEAEYNLPESNLPLNPITDKLESIGEPGEPDYEDFELLGNGVEDESIYQDPQRIIPAEAAEDDFAELPTGRVREYLSRKAKSMPINYVHITDASANAKNPSPPPPRECCQLYQRMFSVANLKVI